MFPNLEQLRASTDDDVDFFLTQEHLRPVDWRWQYAAILSQRGVRQTRNADPFVRRLLGYLNAKHEYKVRGSTLARNYGDVYNADLIYSGNASERHYVEALLMCRDIDNDTICQALGWRPQDVEAYEKCCFDVRPFLHRPLSVSSRVFGVRVDQAAGKPTTAALSDEGMNMKHVAYHLGYEGFTEMWGNAGAVANSVRAWIGEDYDRTAMFRAWAAARSIHVDKYTAPIVVAAYEQHCERIFKEKNEGDGDQETNRMASAMLGGMSFNMCNINTGVSGAFHEPRAMARLNAELEEVQRRISAKPINAHVSKPREESET